MIDLFLSNSITSVSTLYYIFNIKSKETLKIFIISILYDLIITSFIGLHFIIFYILYYLYKIIKIENIYLKYTCMLILYKVILYLILVTFNYTDFSIYIFLDDFFVFIFVNLLSYFILENIKLK
jgi:hypothetical protein